jgi:hypothetical protein
MSIQLKGVKEMDATLTFLKNKKGPLYYRKTILEQLLRLENKSAKLTPVDTGKLRASGLGNATVLSSSPVGAKGIMFYTANYAIYVHERTELKHKPGKQAKFLEAALFEMSGDLVRQMGSTLSKTLFSNRG